MHDGHQIFDHFPLWGKCLVVEHQNFTAMHFAEARKPDMAEPSQPVLMSNDEMADFAPLDAVHKRQEFRPLKVQPTANFCDPFKIDQPPCGAKITQHPLLILKIWALRGAGHPAIQHWDTILSGRCRNAKIIVDIRLGIPAASGRCAPCGRQFAIAIELLQGLLMHPSTLSGPA